MNDLLQQLLPQAPMVALFALMLWTVYQDGKAERVQLIGKVDRANESLDDLKERIVRLEVAEFGTKFPTSAKKPES